LPLTPGRAPRAQGGNGGVGTAVRGHLAGREARPV